jgi:hypothetical protein
MSIKFEKITPGMTLYDNHTTRMGNTMMRRMGEWRVQIVSMTPDGTYQSEGAIVHWNSNRAEWWPRYRLEKLYATTMAERKAKKAARALLALAQPETKETP